MAEQKEKRLREEDLKFMEENKKKREEIQRYIRLICLTHLFFFE